MNDWVEAKLESVADIKLSNVDKKTKENEKPILLCNYMDVYRNSFISHEKSDSFMIATCNKSEYGKFILREGQVAITKDSETPDDIGVSTYIADSFKDVVLGYHLSLITPDEAKLNGKFLHYWLNTKQAKKYFQNNTGGSGQRCSLNLDVIKSIPLRLPIIQMQKSIADVLFDVDVKIELNKKINAALEAMAKTLYDYWFLQFDFPNEEGKPYKSSGGKMVYNKEVKRQVPDGWEVKKLVELTSKTERGISPKYIDEGGVCVLNQKCIRNNAIDFNLSRRHNHSLKNIDKKRIEYADVLVNSTGVGTLGRAAFVKYLLEPVTTADSHITIVRAKVQNICKIFLGFSLTQKQAEIEALGEGSTGQKELSRINLGNLPILLPTPNLQYIFKQIIEPKLFKMANNEKQNQHLIQLRDWLLPMLMNGQVKVGDVEDVVRMAAEES